MPLKRPATRRPAPTCRAGRRRRPHRPPRPAAAGPRVPRTVRNVTLQRRLATGPATSAAAHSRLYATGRFPVVRRIATPTMRSSEKRLSAMRVRHVRQVPNPQRGFTLIELLIAIAIMGFLAAIALPEYREYVQRSRIIDATSRLSDLRVRMEQAFMDFRAYDNAGACRVRDARGHRQRRVPDDLRGHADDVHDHRDRTRRQGHERLRLHRQSGQRSRDHRPCPAAGRPARPAGSRERTARATDGPSRAGAGSR